MKSPNVNRILEGKREDVYLGRRTRAGYSLRRVYKLYQYFSSTKPILMEQKSRRLQQGSEGTPRR